MAYTVDAVNAYSKTATSTYTYPTLRVGSSGEDVRRLQSALGITADGKYGTQTKAAVVSYQQKNGLSADGVAGKNTLSKLYSAPTIPIDNSAAQQKAEQLAQRQREAEQAATIAAQQKASQLAYASAEQQRSEQLAQRQLEAQQVAAQKAAQQAAASAATQKSEQLAQQKAQQVAAATPAIVKPQAAATKGYTDTGTSQSGVVPIVSKPVVPKIVTPTVSSKPVAGIPIDNSAAQQKAEQLAQRKLAQTQNSTQPSVQAGIGIAQKTTGGSYSSNVPTQTSQAQSSLPSQYNANGSSSSIQPIQTQSQLQQTAGVSSGLGIDQGLMSQVSLDSINSEIENTKSNKQAYIDMVQNSTFEYEPGSDPQYFEAASALENTITQAMVARGGLYTSVAQSSISNKLMELQIDFRKQKFDEFLEDRSFNLEMAKYYQSVEEQQYSQQMKLLQYNMDVSDYNLSVQKEAFDQQAEIANFNLALQKEQFDQQMSVANYELSLSKEAFDQQIAVANYNASRSDAAFSKSMQQANYNLSVQKAQASLQQKALDTQMRATETTLTNNALIIESSKNKYDEMLKAWVSNNGRASTIVSNYFGVEPYSLIGSASSVSAITSYASEIEAQKNNIVNEINAYNYDVDLTDMLKSFYTSTAPDVTSNQISALGAIKASDTTPNWQRTRK